MAKDKSVSRTQRDKWISIGKILGISSKEIAEMFNVTVQKVSQVREGMPNVMEEWLSNEVVSTFAIPDQSGFVTPTLKNINDNFTYSSYSEWILEASDNALMAEKARILSMLENGVESDEQLIVAMTGVIAIIDRQLNARRYMKVSDKRKLTDQGRKKVLDEQAKRLDKELADQMAKYQKKIEENEKATNDRLEELKRQVEKREREVAEKREKIRKDLAKAKRAAEAEQRKYKREIEKSKKELENLRADFEEDASDKVESVEKQVNREKVQKKSNNVDEFVQFLSEQDAK
ncbi:hypothetical protein D6C19_11120 [Ligilactobacillus murinus]|uniref:Uncharacterized protein n=2 Tax=Bacteria TaxID=2 RepID=A0A4Q2A3U6_9LACO|nr:hypothetical protein [Ligilactobacillus murinus]RXV63281.1 hypothetical protein D6C19_11120 [Ligilactobacillus murinus]